MVQTAPTSLFCVLLNIQHLTAYTYVQLILTWWDTLKILPLFSGDTEGQSTSLTLLSSLLCLWIIGWICYTLVYRCDRLFTGGCNLKTIRGISVHFSHVLLTAEILIYNVSLYLTFNISAVNEIVCSCKVLPIVFILVHSDKPCCEYLTLSKPWWIDASFVLWKCAKLIFKYFFLWLSKLETGKIH